MTGSKSRRIFIAIKIIPGPALSEAFNTAMKKFPPGSVKWTDRENIHVTLVFLGDTPEETIPAIVSRLKETCSHTRRFEIVLRSTGLFRGMRDPRILWIGIDQYNELAALYNLMSKGLKEEGCRIEDRAFSPHLTLGRIKRTDCISALSWFLDNYHDAVFQKVSVDEIVLYESILLPAGPVYKPLGKFSLI